jgi:hypothetical protein
VDSATIFKSQLKTVPHKIDDTISEESTIDNWSESMSSHNSSFSFSPHHHQSRRMMYKGSPTPSSNASVIASDGDEEGFDDLEFPEGDECLQLVLPACHEPLSTETDPPNPNPSSNSEVLLLDSNLSENDQDPSDGFEIPDDFDWKQSVSAPKPPEPSNTKIPLVHRQPSFSRSSLNKLKAPTTSRDGGIRNIKMGNIPGNAPIHSLMKTTTHFFSKPVKLEDFGDGTELDEFDDLNTTDYQSDSVPHNIESTLDPRTDNVMDVPAVQKEEETKNNAPISNIPSTTSSSTSSMKRPTLKSGADNSSRLGTIGPTARRSDFNNPGGRWGNPSSKKVRVFTKPNV